MPVELSFTVTGARCETHAAMPTIMLRAVVGEQTGATVQALILKCQVRIEPSRRSYGEAERSGLWELFGEPSQWERSLHSFLWAHVPVAVGAFRGSEEFELPLPCTYDLEVSTARYFFSLQDGDVPLVLLFSGTVFSRGDGGLMVEPVDWSGEARFSLPVATWRECVERYFPGSGWLRLSREKLERLAHFKAERALPSYEMVIEQLLKEAGEQA